ncbi:transcription termination/antitermination protein NusG [Candidatus Walczuchella monophlebidarum]|uniref:Transcription termination/antitermination protein NusG n=1 Tax=Candidatus Walczuchella monophlebidarum TaxID=1415657 RepID=A0A068DWP7_9FLAO|nr:transcription termination/antitermination protein NusG [Candidatus Walczuchella monophlebidarum]AID37443.1 transcription termination/antitermination factor [Candidatus Walczuchella monophlebidarum]
MKKTHEKQWYILRTVSGKENQVKYYIENEIQHLGIKENIGKVLVPVKKIIQIRNGKKIKKEKIYYPGYVLIETCLKSQVEQTLKNIPGVISFLSEKKGGHPIPMRKYEVNRMFGIVNELSERNASVSFIRGEKVKIIDGTFVGFSGTIEKIHEEKVSLSVLIFGRKTPLYLSLTQIEKII